jgi:hypothetical protein
MNTKTAAAKANVTTATIRTWCRRNVIAAIKTARGWDIDETSLNHRINLGKRNRPVVYSIETMAAIGGSRWTKAGRDRVYINNIADYLGLDIAYYNSGNVSGATLDGEGIANSRVYGILGCISKVYFDTADGKLHAQYATGADDYEVRYLNGTRDRIDFVDRVFSGIRAAVAAL